MMAKAGLSHFVADVITDGLAGVCFVLKCFALEPFSLMVQQASRS